MPRPSGSERLDRIFERLDQITTYPWGIQRHGRYLNIVQDSGSSLRGRVASIWAERRCSDANAEFIAVSPVEMKWLADTLCLALQAIEELKKEKRETNENN